MPWRASLPMYSLPKTQGVDAAFWAAQREELNEPGAPEALNFSRPPLPRAIKPKNLFTQVCG